MAWHTETRPTTAFSRCSRNQRCQHHLVLALVDASTTFFCQHCLVPILHRDNPASCQNCSVLALLRARRCFVCDTVASRTPLSAQPCCVPGTALCLALRGVQHYFGPALFRASITVIVVWAACNSGVGCQHCFVPGTTFKLVQNCITPTRFVSGANEYFRTCLSARPCL